MNRSRFMTVSAMLLVVFIFLKIYQHNKIVKLIYQKQRMEIKKQKLCKEKDALLVQLYSLQDQQAVTKKAEEVLGMKSLKLSQTVTFTEIVRT